VNSRVVANSSRNPSSDNENEDVGRVTEDEVDATAGAGAVVRPTQAQTQTNPNLLLSGSPGQADADSAVEGPTAGHEASLVISPETTHLAPMINPVPPIAAGAGDDLYRKMIVAPPDPGRILPRITTESLERLDVATLVGLGPGDEAETGAGASPRRSDLLSDFLPSDRRSLEEAFDRFFDQLEDLGDGAPAPYDPACTIPDSLVLAAAIGALELGRRYWRRRRGGDEARRDGTLEGADGGDVGYPGWPGRWSTRLT
jgi:hypothetical protein